MSFKRKSPRTLTLPPIKPLTKLQFDEASISPRTSSQLEVTPKKQVHVKSPRPNFPPELIQLQRELGEMKRELRELEKEQRQCQENALLLARRRLIHKKKSDICNRLLESKRSQIAMFDKISTEDEQQARRKAFRSEMQLLAEQSLQKQGLRRERLLRGMKFDVAATDGEATQAPVVDSGAHSGWADQTAAEIAWMSSHLAELLHFNASRGAANRPNHGGSLLSMSLTPSRSSLAIQPQPDDQPKRERKPLKELEELRTQLRALGEDTSTPQSAAAPTATTAMDIDPNEELEEQPVWREPFESKVRRKLAAVEEAERKEAARRAQTEVGQVAREDCMKDGKYLELNAEANQKGELRVGGTAPRSPVEAQGVEFSYDDQGQTFTGIIISPVEEDADAKQEEADRIAFSLARQKQRFNAQLQVQRGRLRELKDKLAALEVEEQEAQPEEVPADTVAPDAPPEEKEEEKTEKQEAAKDNGSSGDQAAVQQEPEPRQPDATPESNAAPASDCETQPDSPSKEDETTIQRESTPATIQSTTASQRKQSTDRGTPARKEAEQQQKTQQQQIGKYDTEARVIQSAFRRHLARSNLATQLAARSDLEVKMRRDDAAAMIQRWRRTLKPCRRTRMRRRLQRRYYRAEHIGHVAATAVQQIIRAFLARSNVAQLRLKKVPRPQSDPENWL